MQVPNSPNEFLPPEALRALEVMVTQLMSDAKTDYNAPYFGKEILAPEPFPSHNYHTGGRATNNIPPSDEDYLREKARQALVTNEPQTAGGMSNLGYFDRPFVLGGQDTFRAGGFYNQDDMLSGKADDAFAGAEALGGTGEHFLNSNLLKLLEAAKVSRANRFSNTPSLLD